MKSESRKETRFKVLNRHVERLAEKITDLQKIDQRYFWVRLGVLLISAVGLFAAYQSRQSRIFLAAIVLFLVIFSFVVYLNRRVKRSIIRFNFSKSYFSNQIARMQLDWEDIPVGENYPVSAEHPFVSDLNLTGRNSIHQLLNTSISKGGSYRLQDWLLNENPDEEEMMNRQAGVREISTLSGFRSRLALSSNLVTAGEDGPWDGEQLIDWLQKKIPSRSLLPMLILMSFLAAANIAFFVLYTSGILPAVWIISLTIYAGLYLIAYRSMGEVFGQAHHLSMTLDRFRAVLVFLERYTYRPGSYLHSLCEPFKGADLQPSSHLRRIAVIASASSIGTNPVIWLLINVFVPWDVFFAFQLERYKAKMQQILPTWLEAWYELEALNSLANFAYLNPDYSFPQIYNDDEKRCFDAQVLGHPLIPDAEKVCNDFTLDQLGEVVIITGSNMSGKSTFLRTVGVNLVLAYAGAPVNAAHFSARLFRLFSVIQVTDSLADGISYFYAEVRRLKALSDALGIDSELPLFFLIDEIFRGTNNRERQIGGRSYVNMLVGGNGTGLISTHDLELVHIADKVPDVVNYHFEEQIVDGRMSFDYCLRLGPSKTTNALQIMQIEGLPVEE